MKVACADDQQRRSGLLTLKIFLSLFESRSLLCLLRQLIKDCPFTQMTGLLIDIVKDHCQIDSRDSQCFTSADYSTVQIAPQSVPVPLSVPLPVAVAVPVQAPIPVYDSVPVAAAVAVGVSVCGIVEIMDTATAVTTNTATVINTPLDTQTHNNAYIQTQESKQKVEQGHFGEQSVL